MTHTERMKLINEWFDKSLAWETASREFCKLLGVGNLGSCPMMNSGWAMQDAYTKATSLLVGDKSEWLDWWFNDGYRTKSDGNLVTVGDKPMIVRNLEDLCKVIEADMNEGEGR